MGYTLDPKHLVVTPHVARQRAMDGKHITVPVRRAVRDSYVDVTVPWEPFRVGPRNTFPDVSGVGPWVAQW